MFERWDLHPACTRRLGTGEAPPSNPPAEHAGDESRMSSVRPDDTLPPPTTRGQRSHSSLERPGAPAPRSTVVATADAPVHQSASALAPRPRRGRSKSDSVQVPGAEGLESAPPRLCRDEHNGAVCDAFRDGYSPTWEEAHRLLFGCAWREIPSTAGGDLGGQLMFTRSCLSVPVRVSKGIRRYLIRTGCARLANKYERERRRARNAATERERGRAMSLEYRRLNSRNACLREQLDHVNNAILALSELSTKRAPPVVLPQ